MRALTHAVNIYYQPTTTTCGYAALATLLSHYDTAVSVEQLLARVPQSRHSDGTPIGSVTAQLAAWCAQQGFTVNFWSFDFLITDFSWRNLSQAELGQKLIAVQDVRDVPQVGGKHWSKVYIDAYIEMLQASGILHIDRHVSSAFLYEQLEHGPLYVNIAPAVVSGDGRARYPKPNERIEIADDIHGTTGTHSVVIYGVNEAGEFLVADPWVGERIIGVETMLCAITAANIECDSQCFQLAN